MTSTPEPQAPPAVEQLPHGLLPAYYRDEAEHQRYLRRIFDETAGDYDRIERVLAMGSGRRYRKMALQRGGLKPGDKVVDVGIGTGLLAREAFASSAPREALSASIRARACSTMSMCPVYSCGWVGRSSCHASTPKRIS